MATKLTLKQKTVNALTKAGQKGMTADRIAKLLWGKDASYATHKGCIDGKIVGMKLDGLDVAKVGRGAKAVYCLGEW